MDKRYVLILIIIVVCCTNLYMIADVSNVIGSASVNVGNYTFSLPEGFSLYEDRGSQVYISNPNSNMDIWVYTYLNNENTFSDRIAKINNDSNLKILSNGSIDKGNIVIHSVYYQKVGEYNRSDFYFTKENNNFRILISGFDYDSQKTETIELVSSIVDSIHINYKL